MIETTLMGRCSRPKCRTEFPVSVKAGQPPAYCSPGCLSDAREEYRVAVSIFAHYERLADYARRDVATFGRMVVVVPPDDCKCEYVRGEAEWWRMPEPSCPVPAHAETEEDS